MSTPPPTGSVAPPGSGVPPREHVLPLEPERSRMRRRSAQGLLTLGQTGATLENPRYLRAPLRLPLGSLQLGLVERGSSQADGRFPILRRLGPTAVIPREHGIEGWLWTRTGGSALTMLGDEELGPNAALLFTKPLSGAAIAAAFEPEAQAELAARSPLGTPAVFGLLLRVADPGRAEDVFRRFGLLRPLTDREVPPTLRRSLPTDRSPDPGVRAGDGGNASTSVAPPGAG
jgi:hypothetical protein